MSTTVITDAVTGEVKVQEWTAEQIEARRLRLTPMQWDALRSKRNILLDKSDAYVLPDRWYSYTSEQQTSWSAYRQALRDLPTNTSDPFNVIWPLKPE